MDEGRKRPAYPELRRRLSTSRGRAFWRGLEQLAGTDEFRRFVEAEFPSAASFGDTTRRDFLRVMGASLMLAGLSGCGEPPEEAVPYVDAPEDVIPGRPRFYATAVTLEGYAQPVLGETHVGRPTKLEGNPDHTASGGATDAFTQAAVLQLYDPDRSKTPTHLGRATGWPELEAAMVGYGTDWTAKEGAGLAILTGAFTSPTLRRQFDALRDRYARASWHVFEPVGQGLRPVATRRAFGRPLDVHLHLDRAALVVSLDDDFLGPGPWQVANARRWAMRRMAAQRGEGACRLHVAEPIPSLTGSVATTRRMVEGARIGRFVLGIARALGIEAGPDPGLEPAEQSWVTAIARELSQNEGRSLVTVGAHQAPEIQALGFRINDRLANPGKTVVYTEPVSAFSPDGAQPIEGLAREMAAGRVAALVVLGPNPAYAAPADLDFAGAMERVPLRIHAGLYYDETAALSHWHVPLAHALECWSDARAVDGTATILQPLVRPFYDVRSLHEAIALLGGDTAARGRDIVQATWRQAFGAQNFEARWRRALHDGFVPDSAAPPVEARLVGADEITPSEPSGADSIEVVFRPDPTIWDGRFANLGWLQELPKPLTKLTWDNVIGISPGLGARLGVANGDHVEIATATSKLAGPAWIMPGQASRTVAVFLGYGRRRAGQVGDGIGYDGYRLRRSAAPWLEPDASIRRVEGRTELATTQLHFSMEGFDFVRVVARTDADRPIETGEPRKTLYPIWEDHDPSWGMAIDLDLCIGCNACVTACQAENNIAVVGKEQVAMGREMHWLRVDRYYEGGPDRPRFHFQPVPCMHCEQAPCEMGCPVHATVHGPEGLNQMVYNRCIGTRTCSSFCPYKVRRFNWYDYTGDDPPSIQAQRNPNVTVRDRGVMEKCTYCVQRISAARIDAKIAQRPIRDGEVKTACQAVCPTRAIVFGNIKDPESAVSRAKRSPRNYSLLKELNTWPRTTYLAEIDDSGPGAGGENA